ncbi:hypothetical protein NDU88_001261 [Pleurodeles waltl]|uniref:Uncharacterized protein n=1 Tax=Pleurodeles waltl TaxID=8319 RepID=A0AAV7Q6D2_PLEWA|nr:hypothetical protein NDU88_001261 [Pleurodeles waltl]
MIGVLLHGALQMAEKFRTYYADQSQIPYSEQATADYLEHIAMKWLSDSHRERFMAPLHPAEITAVLKDTPTGKAPGSISISLI